MAKLKRSKLSIGQHRYGQIYEKYIAKGKTHAQAHKIASSPLMHRPDKVDRASLADKLISKGLRLGKKLRRKKK